VAATLRDLGQLAGVSHTTVARALKGNRNVSEVVRQRVVNAARELNYDKISRFDHRKSVAVCVMNVNIPLCSSIMKGAEDILHEHGYSVIIQSVGCHGRHPSEVVPRFRSRGIGAVILQPGMCLDNANWLLDSVGAGFPIVLIDCKLPYINMPYVVSDNFGGAVKLVKELASQNCKKIAFFGIGGIGLSSVQERLAGYRAGLSYCGLPVNEDLILTCNMEWTHHPKFLSWMNGSVKVDGVFTMNDMAFEFLVDKCMSENREFLGRCKFATFDFPVRGFHYPVPITVAVQDTYRMGADAAKIAIELCEGRKSSGKVRQEVLDIEIIRNVACPLNSSVVKGENISNTSVLI